MPVAATGAIGKSLEALRTSLANVTAWQTWTGSADATAAANKIHLIDLPKPEDDESREPYAQEDVESLRPFAIVGLPDNSGGMDSVAEGVAVYTDSYTLQLEIEAAPLAGVSEADAEMTFINNLDAILLGLKQNSRIGGYLYINSLRVTSLQRPSRTAGQGDYFSALIEITATGAGS
jgi:hypothetical protein